MNDYALVLNAGSSSLKFCVYHQSEPSGWRLETRGQIEGIGTAPRLSARDDAGALLDEQSPRGDRAGRSRGARRARRVAAQPLRRRARPSASVTASFTAARATPVPRWSRPTS